MMPGHGDAVPPPPAPDAISASASAAISAIGARNTSAQPGTAAATAAPAATCTSGPFQPAPPLAAAISSAGPCSSTPAVVPRAQRRKPPPVEKLKPSPLPPLLLPSPSPSPSPSTSSPSSPSSPPPQQPSFLPPPRQSSSSPPPPPPSPSPSLSSTPHPLTTPRHHLPWPPPRATRNAFYAPQLDPLSRPASPPDSERGRLGGRADSVFPTAPHALPPESSSSAAAASPPPAVHAPPNLRLPRLSQQPVYPSHQSGPAVDEALTTPPPTYPSSVQQPGHRAPSPFRSRAAASNAGRSHRLLSARLWNPTNSTPRDTRPRKRRASSPPAPSVPIQHPSLDKSAEASEDPAAGDYPLLTLSEQRQSKHSPTARTSFHFEHDRRVSLPRSVRASYDGSRSRVPTPAQSDFDNPAGAPEHIAAASEFKGKALTAAMAHHGLDDRPGFQTDLERGPDVLDPRRSNVSAGDAMGSALSSSNSSIMGEDVQPDVGEEWGPQHPCFPHLNPHVPLDSFEYASTRIIRVRRDWLLQGDLAPTFSNIYPEILDPAGVSEQEFRRIIEKVNGELVPIFDPYSFRNIVDSLLGLATGWLWDDLGLTAIKSRLSSLEKWIEKWNLEMEKTMASEEGAVTPKIIPLRQTAYMMLDIQIPDPEIAPAPSSIAGDSRTALPVEAAAAATA